MLSLTTDQRTALAQRIVMRRIFIWCEARDPDTGDPDPVGFWDDVGDVEIDAQVYHGSGSLIQISSLSAKGDLTIPAIEIVLSGIDIDANVLARARSIEQAPIRIYIGLFNPATHAIITPLFPYFTGFIDNCVIKTGDESSIALVCESSSRALTRVSQLTRSAASEQERDANDLFYSYTSAAASAPVYFGQSAPAT